MKSLIRWITALCLVFALLTLLPGRAEATEMKSGIGTVTGMWTCRRGTVSASALSPDTGMAGRFRSQVSR